MPPAETQRNRHRVARKLRFMLRCELSATQTATSCANVEQKEGENGLTLSDIAKEYHVSAQAIRNRLQRAGYSLESIREPGTNQITADGERIIKELFTAAPTGKKTGKKSKGSSTVGNGSGSGGQLAVIRAERDELKIRTATAETLAEERRKTIEFLQEQIREKDATISKLAAAAAVKAALPAPDPAQDAAAKSPKKSGFFARFRKKT